MTIYDIETVKNIYEQINKFGQSLRNIINRYLDQYEENHHIRSKKTKMLDGFCITLLSVRKGTKQRTITKLLNKFLQENISYQSFISRKNHINNKLLLQISKDLQNYVLLTKTPIGDVIAVDGTKIYTLIPLSYLGFPTNQTKTCSNPLIIGIYDTSLKIPQDLYLSNNLNERESFIKYINENYKKYQNKILVFDAGFFSFDVLETLEKYKLKYIINIRKDLKFVPKLTKNLYDNLAIFLHNNNAYILRLIGFRSKKNKKSNIDDDENYIKNDSITDIKLNKNVNNKYIKSDLAYIFDIDDDDKKDNENIIKSSEIIEEKDIQKWYISNQISNEISADFIINCYKKRWEGEEYFKEIKSNNVFEYIKIETINELEKTLNSNLIINYIIDILEYILTENIKRNGKYKINKSQLYDGVYDEMIMFLLYNKLTEENLSAWLSNNISFQEIRNERYFDRTSNIPVFKWFSKKSVIICDAKKKGILKGDKSNKKINTKNYLDENNIPVYLYNKSRRYILIDKIKKLEIIGNQNKLTNVLNILLKKHSKNIEIISINSNITEATSDQVFQEYRSLLEKSLEYMENVDIELFTEKNHNLIKINDLINL